MVDIAAPPRPRKGIFTRWQPVYAERKIATFPLNEEKVPRIRRWHKIGIKGSTELADKFTDAEALGFVTGRASSVTILDIDTADENVTADAMARHGEPRIITRTASGKHHLFYRYNGEGRRIRPWAGLEIDVLGDNGYAVAAPSKLIKGAYEIIHGHLDDLDRLKPMADTGTMPVPAKWSGMRQGDGRNRALWERCMRAGADFGPEQMIELGRQANQQFKEPLMDAEVVKIATSAWQHDAAGLNFFTRPRIMIDHDIFDSLGSINQDAVFLLLKLERHHGGNDSFILSKTMCTSMEWGLPRWYSARDLLVKIGAIRCIEPGGRGPNDPPIYGWGTKGL
jgi:hypothetical protein